MFWPRLPPARRTALIPLSTLNLSTRARAALVVGALGCVVACNSAPTPAAADGDSMPAVSPARLYLNARVLTFAEPGEATGLRIEGERITHVFSGAVDATLSGERIDLAGATILPGLVDAHFHLQGLGELASQLDLRGTTSRGQILDRVAAAARALPAGAWLVGRGWDQNDWPDKAYPTAADLDAVVADRPIFLERIDGHAGWVNKAALSAAKIDAHTVAPQGGEIQRNKDGAPSGILVDNAMDAVTAAIPPPSRAEIRARYERALDLCRRAGLTGIHDMGVTPQDLEILRELDREGALTLRHTAYLRGNNADLETLLRQPPNRTGLVRVVGVKLFADGALGSRGAALLAPYSDHPETSGLLLLTPEELRQRAQLVHARGYQLAIHAIGDRGNRLVLDAIAAAQGSDTTRRHRVEHAQVVDLADLPRFASLGAVASMQPTHATSDMPWAEARLGKSRLAGAYAWRKMLRGGVALAFGSDAPVEEHNPWLGIYAAASRADLEGAPTGGWLAEEKLSVTEALAAFSAGAAWASADPDLGRIAPGMLADLTIVDADPRAVPAAALAKIRTLRTVVGGREVFVAR